MKNNLKTAAVNIKNNVVAHKTHLLTSALIVTTTLAALQQIGLNQHDQFLKDNDLYDTFYDLTTDEI